MELTPLQAKAEDIIRSSFTARDYFQPPKTATDIVRSSLQAPRTTDDYRLSQYGDPVSQATSQLVSEHDEPEKKSYVEGLLHTPLKELARKHESNAVNRPISNENENGSDDLETLIRELGEFNNSISRKSKPHEEKKITKLDEIKKSAKNPSVAHKFAKISTTPSKSSNISSKPATTATTTTTKKGSEYIKGPPKELDVPKDTQGEMMGTKQDPDEVDEASLTKAEDGSSVFKYLIQTKPKTTQSSQLVKKSVVGGQLSEGGRLSAGRRRSPVETLIDALKRKVRFEKDLIKTFVNYVCDKECLS